MTTKTLKRPRMLKYSPYNKKTAISKEMMSTLPSHDNNNGTTINHIRACLLLRCFLVDLLLGCTQLGYNLDTLCGAEKRFGWWGWGEEKGGEGCLYSRGIVVSKRPKRKAMKSKRTKQPRPKWLKASNQPTIPNFRPYKTPTDLSYTNSNNDCLLLIGTYT
jgi:hypothetical protein